MNSFKNFITESEQNNKVINYIRKLLLDYFENDSNCSSIKKDSRHYNQLRISYSNTGENDLENKLNKKIEQCYSFIKINDTDHSGSDKYNTFELSINFKDIKNDISQKNNEKLFNEILELYNIDRIYKCYIVYTIPRNVRKTESRSSFIPTKTFIPEKFGIEINKKYTKNELYNTIVNKFKNLSSKDNCFKLFEKYIKTVIAKSCDTKCEEILYSNDTLNFKNILPSEVDCINKDFGEVVCALNVLNEYPDSYIVFPPSNEKVIDFNLCVQNYDTTNIISYSVKNKGKYKGTAFSGLKGIFKLYKDSIKEVNDVPLGFKEFCEYANILFTDAEYNNNDKILIRIPDKIFKLCYKFIEYHQTSIISEMIEEIKLCFGISKTEKITLSKLKEKFEYIIKQHKIDECVELLNGFYTNKKFGFKFKNTDNEKNKVKQLILDKKYGLVVYPLAYTIVKEINKISYITNCLSNVINYMENFKQIETNIFINKSGELVYEKPKIKDFDKHSFIFNYHGKRDDTGSNVSIGFIMEK